MEWARKEFNANETSYVIRSAVERDAEELSLLRLREDRETENLGRESGEGFIDPYAYTRLIALDAECSRNLFLVAEASGERLLAFLAARAAI